MCATRIPRSRSESGRRSLPPDVRRPSLPVEFVGLARNLRRKLVASSEASRVAVDQVLAPLHRELDRRLTMRAETVAGAMRAWRHTMPGENRVSLDITMRSGRAHIHQICFLASELSRPHWNGWEPGVVLTELDVTLDRRRGDMAERDLAAFSLHAMARRFQRSSSAAERTDAAVLRDMAALAVHDPDTMPEGEFSLPAANGCWVGHRTLFEGKPVLSVRTFYDADAAVGFSTSGKTPSRRGP